MGGYTPPLGGCTPLWRAPPTKTQERHGGGTPPYAPHRRGPPRVPPSGGPRVSPRPGAPACPPVPRGPRAPEPRTTRTPLKSKLVLLQTRRQVHPRSSRHHVSNPVNAIYRTGPSIPGARLGPPKPPPDPPTPPPRPPRPPDPPPVTFYGGGPPDPPIHPVTFYGGGP